MMASATPLKDIDGQFLQCCLCMEQLKEPKILPCLHRYCRECLKKFAKERGQKIQCVTCREQHTLPKGGIDGLKTDFNTKNIIEFIQLQDSVNIDPLRTCIHCKKKLQASAFCFRCNDFLCETCHQFHASSSIVKDHHPHIFSLSKAEAANLTIQKLSSLKVAPRCQAHPGKLSELCCTTCDSLPVCVPCTYGEHQGHNLKEVTSLAKIQREMLRGKVADLMQYKEKAYRTQEEVRKEKEELDINMVKERMKALEQLDAEEERIKETIRNMDEELTRKGAELEGGVNAKESLRKKDLEQRMRKLREEFELVCEEEGREAVSTFRKLQEANKRETERLQEGLRAVIGGIKEQLTSLNTQKDEQARKIKELSEHFDGIVIRFGTVTTTVDCIRAAENDWADVQCIPDVCRAIDLLSEDVKKSSLGLGNLSVVRVRDLSPAVTVRRKVGISKHVESVIHMQNVMGECEVNDITCNTDGRIAVISWTPNNQTHLTVINMKSDLLHQKLIPARSLYCTPKCSFLTQSQIAFIHEYDEVGIYDMGDQSLKSAMLKEVITNWPSNQWVSSVTTDPTNGYIIVGCDSRYVYVFNDQLQHINTITLPACIGNAHDIAMHEGSLLVCDSFSRRAFAVTVHGTASQVKYEFTEPTNGRGNWGLVSVCTDQNGYVYMLWRDEWTRKSVIVQYSRDSSQIEMMRKVSGKHDIPSMTSVRTKQRDKLLLPKENPPQILVYGLV